jgi:WD40 repeat protein
MAFHKESQHFFITDENNEIVIFDLSTAMKWKKLKGHTCPITCIAVEEKGNFLATFSIRDKTLKIWKVR